MAKKKRTHRERGYAEQKDAIATLQQLIQRIESFPPKHLIKLSMQIWLASEDEPEKRGQYSAMMCAHANEVPARCPCDADCYCKTHTCAHRR